MVPTSWKEGISINKHFLDRTIGLFFVISPETGAGVYKALPPLLKSPLLLSQFPEKQV